ncbi:hypothetical protein B0T22DRAFT_435661 [Podospora appendiculata]|uniref:Uncharacterized protein n=1 Tax=Podospora appendiculata TaxID=314037 RepID=A0AAE0XFE0_9PEZI|nr:hypothetical protein B0T22DRAFT_435661 [Podospora appendiculata]
MEKGPSSSEFEVESRDNHLHSKVRTIRMVDTARIAATALALLMGLTVLGVSSNTLSVYDYTHLTSDFFLPLWPEEFNIRPTVALVAGSVFVIVSNIAALCFSKVQVLRNKTTAHTAVTFVAPFIGLVAAMIAMIFFYSVNASDSVDTFLSWTCRWTSVPMTQQPHWGALCSQSRAGLYLSILLIPVEAAALGLAGYQMKLERYTDAYSSARKGSPSPS